MKEFVGGNKLCKKNLEEAMNSDTNTVNLIIGSFYTYDTVVDGIKKNRNKRKI